MLTFGRPQFEVVQLPQVLDGVFEALRTRVGRNDKRQELRDGIRGVGERHPRLRLVARGAAGRHEVGRPVGVAPSDRPEVDDRPVGGRGLRVPAERPDQRDRDY